MKGQDGKFYPAQRTPRMVKSEGVAPPVPVGIIDFGTLICQAEMIPSFRKRTLTPAHLAVILSAAEPEEISRWGRVCSNAALTLTEMAAQMHEAQAVAGGRA